MIGLKVEGNKRIIAYFQQNVFFFFFKEPEKNVKLIALSCVNYNMTMGAVITFTVVKFTETESSQYM